jgi:hypothetical protein
LKTLETNLRRLQILVTSKKFYSLILVLLVTALLFSACGDNTATKAPAATTAPAATVAVTTAATTKAATTAPAATTVATTTAPAATTVATTAPATATKAAATTAPAATTAASTGNIQFQTFSSAEGRFSVLMPGTPKPTKQTAPLTNSTITTDLYLFQADSPNDGGVFFTVYNDYPADQVKQQSLQTILNNIRDGQINAVKGKLLNEKDITLSQIPGKETEISGSGAYIKGRYYLAGNRLYQVYVAYPEGQQSTKNIQTFLDSFKISATGNATPASSTDDLAAIIDSLKEIEVDPSVLKAVSALPNVTSLDVKMFVGDDTAEKIATSLDQGLLKIGYKFSLPGATKLNKIGASSFGGFYTAAGQPDVLLGATALVAGNLDQTVKNLDELSVPGLADSDLQKLFGQLSGKKSLIVVISGSGLEKALFSK